MQQNSAFAQQPQRNQALATRRTAAEGQIGGSGDESDSPISLAAVRENAKATLAEIDSAELLASAAIAVRYEKRLRDLGARTELWERNIRPEAEAVVRQQRNARDENEGEALIARRRQLWAPVLRVDQKIKQTIARYRAAKTAIRERYRAQRRAIFLRLREADAAEAGRFAAERRDRALAESRQAEAEVEAQRIAREVLDKAERGRLAAERSRERAQKAEAERRRYQSKPRPSYTTAAEKRAARQRERAERAHNRIAVPS